MLTLSHEDSRFTIMSCLNHNQEDNMSWSQTGEVRDL